MLHRFSEARALVIDDDPARIQYLVGLLERAGLRGIASAPDGRTGADVAALIHPDVILLALAMPGMDGYAVLDELAATSGDPSYLPVVVTVDPTKDTVHRALSLGARDFLATPFDATEVILRVRNLLETGYLQRTLREHNIALSDALERRTAQEHLRKRMHDDHRDRIEGVLSDATTMGMVFQPIIDLTDHSVVGMEALSRFATEPLRSPDLWFAEAASVGLGPTLEMKAVRAAVAHVSQLPDGAFMAVNASPELMMSGMLDSLADDPACSRLVFELTEHEAVVDYGPIRDRMQPLLRAGARIAVDDTGAGFASLRHILLLQPQIIKLDRSLTHGVDHDPARRALAASLVSFAHDIGSELIAEGVETLEELATLERLGAHWAQGFHIARPEPLPV
jgi:EAL domain-containing protein (putative c-di-GMP-specific phosphodiesterase class I)/ActR/RegA family two-component response regulator